MVSLDYEPKPPEPPRPVVRPWYRDIGFWYLVLLGVLGLIAILFDR